MLHYNEIGKNRLRRTVLTDKEYRRWLDEQFGIDLLGRSWKKIPGTAFGAKLDPDYFLENFKKNFDSYIKIVE